MSQSETKTMPKAVDRYDFITVCADGETPSAEVALNSEGEFVTYSAYSALTEQVAALKAECERLEETINELNYKLTEETYRADSLVEKAFKLSNRSK